MQVDQAVSSRNWKRAMSEGGFRPDIEGLRGIAVVLVVLFHAGVPGWRGGFVGVDVFFVLSGYLITGLLVAEAERKGRIDLVRFYARRARRLLPASALTVWVTVIAALCLLAPTELRSLGTTATATALYASNILFAGVEADYFAAAVEPNPLLHMWSLAVEEQFYLVWPLLIIAGMRQRESIRRLVWLIMVLTIGSLIVSVWWTDQHPNWAFYGSPARAWEFGIGGLASLLPRGRVELPKRWIVLLGWLGLAGIILSGMWITRKLGFPGWLAAVPSLATAVTLVAGAEAPGAGVFALLNTRVLQALGKLSYSWYLWHWPALVFTKIAIPSIGPSGSLLVALITLVVAAITHSTVENPIRFNQHLVPRAALTLGCAAVLTMFTTGTSLWLRHGALRMSQRPEFKAMTDAANDLPPLPTDRCYSTGLDETFRVCEFGDTTSQLRIVLFGDSHAAQWFAPLKGLAEESHWRLVTMMKSSCPATDTYQAHPTLGWAFADGCARWRTQAREAIAKLRPDLVVTGSSTAYVGIDDYSVSLDEWGEGTRRNLMGFAALGIPVLQIRDVPRATFNVPTCLARAVHSVWPLRSGCALDSHAALRADVFDTEREAAGGLAGVRFADLSLEFCGDDSCPAKLRGVIVYQDDNHITSTFARSLKPVLGREIRLALQGK